MSNRAERRRQARASARAARHPAGCPDCGYDGPGWSDEEMAAAVKAQLAAGSVLMVRPEDVDRVGEEYDAIQGLPESVDYLIAHKIGFRVVDPGSMWLSDEVRAEVFGPE